MDIETINCIEEYIPVKNPLTKKYPFNLLIEISGYNLYLDLFFLYFRVIKRV